MKKVVLSGKKMSLGHLPTPLLPQETREKLKQTKQSESYRVISTTLPFTPKDARNENHVMMKITISGKCIYKYIYIYNVEDANIELP